MILTNCTDAPRGLALQKGVKVLEPREMWMVPAGQRDEIKALFKSETFQRFVDNDIFRLSKMSTDEESVVVKTPEPPADLAPVVGVDSLERPVSTETGSRASAPVVVEHQTGGQVVEPTKTTKTKAKK